MRNKAFWVEYIIMLGVLLVVVSVAFSGLMQANKMSQGADEITEASLRSQNLIEYAKANSHQLEESLEAIGGLAYKEGYIFYYDEDWQWVSSEEAATFIIAFQMQEIDYEVDTLIDCNIVSYKKDGGTLLVIESNMLRNERT